MSSETLYKTTNSDAEYSCGYIGTMPEIAPMKSLICSTILAFSCSVGLKVTADDFTFYSK